MKISTVAYTPLHYGKEYLRWAVASVAPVVGRHIILYTPKPSYGHGTALPCPDTEEELRACVAEFDHVEWHAGEWGNESAHRGAVAQFLRPSDEILLPVDADEVWDLRALQHVIEFVWNARAAREWRVHGFLHHYRSFWYVCTDAMSPTRVIDLRVEGEVKYVTGKVHHFGYAQSVEMVRYKWSCHGHKNELRQDCNWLEDKYINCNPRRDDVHPTCVGIWNPRYISCRWPAILYDHPYAYEEVIDSEGHI
jgi:hypothetical protein